MRFLDFLVGSEKIKVVVQTPQGKRTNYITPDLNLNPHENVGKVVDQQYEAFLRKKAPKSLYVSYQNSSHSVRVW